MDSAIRLVPQEQLYLERTVLPQERVQDAKLVAHVILRALLERPRMAIDARPREHAPRHLYLADVITHARRAKPRLGPRVLGRTFLLVLNLYNLSQILA